MSRPAYNSKRTAKILRARKSSAHGRRHDLFLLSYEVEGGQKFRKALIVSPTDIPKSR
jgi:hypothetical protein